MARRTHHIQPPSASRGGQRDDPSCLRLHVLLHEMPVLCRVVQAQSSFSRFERLPAARVDDRNSHIDATWASLHHDSDRTVRCVDELRFLLAGPVRTVHPGCHRNR